MGREWDENVVQMARGARMEARLPNENAPPRRNTNAWTRHRMRPRPTKQEREGTAQPAPAGAEGAERTQRAQGTQGAPAAARVAELVAELLAEWRLHALRTS